MAISASSEHREFVLNSTQANLHDAIAGLLNVVVAHCLPTRPGSRPLTPEECERSTSVTAQAASPQAALTKLIGDLLNTIDEERGGIGGVELQGVMIGPERCTIWAQACLAAPAPYTPLAVSCLSIEQTTGETSITVTLRSGE